MTEAEVIQVNYDQLGEIAGRFAAQAEANEEMIRRVEQCAQALQDGGWEGEGSQAFFAEMETAVIPSTYRLIDALREAGSVTLQIEQLMRQAEEEASLPFREGDIWDKMDEGGKEFVDLMPQVEGRSSGSGGTHDLDPRTSPPPRNAAELYRMIHHDTDNHPVKVVQIGPDEYLVMIAGTKGFEEDRDWTSAVASGVGVTTPYENNIRRYLKEIGVPEDATLHLAGHSQGGITANNLAGNPDFMDKYNVESVTTFGSPVSHEPIQGVEYTRYEARGDIVPDLQSFIFDPDAPQARLSQIQLFNEDTSIIGSHDTYREDGFYPAGTDSLSFDVDQRYWGSDGYNRERGLYAEKGIEFDNTPKFDKIINTGIMTAIKQGQDQVFYPLEIGGNQIERFTGWDVSGGIDFMEREVDRFTDRLGSVIMDPVGTMELWGIGG